MNGRHSTSKSETTVVKEETFSGTHKQRKKASDLQPQKRLSAVRGSSPAAARTSALPSRYRRETLDPAAAFRRKAPAMAPVHQNTESDESDEEYSQSQSQLAVIEHKEQELADKR